MSVSCSHPLHQQTLRAMQVRTRLKKIWFEQRQSVYDLRDRINAMYHKKIKAAVGAEKQTLGQEHLQAYLKIKSVIDRFNFASIDVMEGSESAYSEAQRHAFVFDAFMAFQLSAELESFVDLHDALDLASDFLIPPGLAVRQTPRRPGAPSSALPH